MLSIVMMLTMEVLQLAGGLGSWAWAVSAATRPKSSNQRRGVTDIRGVFALSPSGPSGAESRRCCEAVIEWWQDTESELKSARQEPRPTGGKLEFVFMVWFSWLKGYGMVLPLRGRVMKTRRPQSAGSLGLVSRWSSEPLPLASSW